MTYKNAKITFLLLLLILFLSACESKKDNIIIGNTLNPLEKATSEFKNYDNIQDREVMVIGTFHYNQDALKEDHQKSIKELVATLKKYNPNKILLEWEPLLFEQTNAEYHQYLNDSFTIDKKYNEVYQIGFRLAKELKLDSLYLFDNKTEFIGSLKNFATQEDPFSFDLFTTYAKKEDDGFYNTHEKSIIDFFAHNQQVVSNFDYQNRTALLNSDEFQRINAQRMHMYEIRVGIQKNWGGPDWVGRWYRRNIRMAGITLKITKPGDKILILVGDNHKWILDRLFTDIPEFKVASSWDYLKKQLNN